MDKINSMLKDFDIAVLLPEIKSFMGSMGMFTWLLTLIGPAVLLVLGLLYFFKPPKEANYIWGYRSYFTMGSVEAWRFSQKIAGISWIGLGGLLTIVMLVRLFYVTDMDVEQAVISAIWCVLIEIGLVALSGVVIHCIVLKFFDKDGNRRIRPQRKYGK